MDQHIHGNLFREKAIPGSTVPPEGGIEEGKPEIEIYLERK